MPKLKTHEMCNLTENEFQVIAMGFILAGFLMGLMVI